MTDSGSTNTPYSFFKWMKNLQMLLESLVTQVSYRKIQPYQAYVSITSPSLILVLAYDSEMATPAKIILSWINLSILWIRFFFAYTRKKTGWLQMWYSLKWVLSNRFCVCKKLDPLWFSTCSNLSAMLVNYIHVWQVCFSKKEEIKNLIFHAARGLNCLERERA